MTATAPAEGWAFEEVAPAEIDQALERQRRSGDSARGALVRASVANLVVVTRTRAAGQQALVTVEQLGARAPSRCVVLIAEPPEGRQGVRSWARVVNRRPEQGPEVVWEEVVVQTNVHPRHLTAVVLPLLLPELPVFTWWEGTPPFDQEVFAELTSVTDRLIVDSAEWHELAYGDLAGVFGRTAVSDIAWARIYDWRVELARYWPEIREQEIRVRGPRAEATLLRAWLNSRLDRAIAPVEPAGEIGVRVGGEELRPPRVSPPTPSDLLSAELDRFSRDPIYEEAAAAAAR
jgi:glucose-6-phosphate dehydrogenase assembly protein OpcA